MNQLVIEYDPVHEYQVVGSCNIGFTYLFYVEKVANCANCRHHDHWFGFGDLCIFILKLCYVDYQEDQSDSKYSPYRFLTQLEFKYFVVKYLVQVENYPIQNKIDDPLRDLVIPQIVHLCFSVDTQTRPVLLHVSLPLALKFEYER